MFLIRICICIFGASHRNCLYYLLLLFHSSGTLSRALIFGACHRNCSCVLLVGDFIHTSYDHKCILFLIFTQNLEDATQVSFQLRFILFILHLRYSQTLTIFSIIIIKIKLNQLFLLLFNLSFFFNPFFFFFCSTVLIFNFCLINASPSSWTDDDNIQRRCHTLSDGGLFSHLIKNSTCLPRVLLSRTSSTAYATVPKKTCLFDVCFGSF
jgi:hypothetical protein